MGEDKCLRIPNLVYASPQGSSSSNHRVKHSIFCSECVETYFGDQKCSYPRHRDNCFKLTEYAVISLANSILITKLLMVIKQQFYKF